MKKNSIIIISGPTASGKTSLSIEVAKRWNGEVVNFDSLLFYKELNIGTAKPSDEETQGVPHHLMSNVSISTPINAADFMKMAIPVINKLHSEGKLVVLVGGSGFYLQAVLKGMYESETTSPEILKRSEELFQAEGIKPFREVLKLNDPPSYERYHENDHYRVRRAVEHFWMTGQPFSSSRNNMEERLKNSPEIQFGWNTYHAYLDIPKEQHFEIIQKRTNQMIQDGLELEVQSLLNQGFTGEEKPLKSIGYKEMIGKINGEFATEEEFIERLNINTRRLAKSQRTWFKKVDKQSYNSLTEREKLFTDIESFLKE